jgi:hypothetical protein
VFGFVCCFLFLFFSSLSSLLLVMEYGDETKARAVYENWRQTDDKSNFHRHTAQVLRQGWRKSDKQLPAGTDRAHWMDVEVVAAALEKMPGPKPSFEYLKKVGEELRSNDNWRPLSHQRNISERAVAQVVKEGQAQDHQGHAAVKLRKQAQWLLNHQEKLPAGLVNQLAKGLQNQTDTSTQKPFLDMKQLQKAGSQFNVPPRQQAPTMRELDAVKKEVAKQGHSKEKEKALIDSAKKGELRLKKDGSLDKRSKAAAHLKERSDSGIDGRTIKTESVGRKKEDTSNKKNASVAPRKENAGNSNVAKKAEVKKNAPSQKVVRKPEAKKNSGRPNVVKPEVKKNTAPRKAVKKAVKKSTGQQKLVKKPAVKKNADRPNVVKKPAVSKNAAGPKPVKKTTKKNVASKKSVKVAPKPKPVPPPKKIPRK